MRNSSQQLAGALALAAVFACASRAEAQVKAQGFALERLYPSAPGGGWVVMDALDMRGGLGGGMSASFEYAHDPLRVTDGSQTLPVVSGQATADFGFAATYDRFRLYLNMDMLLFTDGQSGTVGAYQFTAPSGDISSKPDTLTDARVGFDTRIVGGPRSPFRLGAGVQLFIPNGLRSDYDTDGTYRFMGRVLFAGDVGRFSYAGHVGVHVRPLDDSPTPGSPRGSELLFGLAAGARFPLGRDHSLALIVGPEIFGASNFFDPASTALEALLTGRLEGTGDDGPQFRVKLGTGGGINPVFGAPEWRLVCSLEVFDHHTDRDKDGVSDSHDACPDTPGIGTDDPRTNGCPKPTGFYPEGQKE